MKFGQVMRQVVNRINGIDFNNLTNRKHFGEGSLATTTLHALLEALLHAAFVQEPLAPEGAA